MKLNLLLLSLIMGTISAMEGDLHIVEEPQQVPSLKLLCIKNILTLPQRFLEQNAPKILPQNLNVDFRKEWVEKNTLNTLLPHLTRQAKLICNLGPIPRKVNMPKGFLLDNSDPDKIVFTNKDGLASLIDISKINQAVRFFEEEASLKQILLIAAMIEKQKIGEKYQLDKKTQAMLNKMPHPIKKASKSYVKKRRKYIIF